MFDTSVVRARSIGGSRRFTFLAASMGIHSAAVLAAIAMSVAATQLPTDAPKQFALYRPVEIPRVPAARGTQSRAETTTRRPPARPAPAQLTAPAVIPDQTPVVSADPGPAAPNDSVDDGRPGVPWGTDESVDTGVIAEPPPVPQVERPYTPGRDVVAARVLRRVEPRYPNTMLTTRMGATVTVRCIIGRDGAIRDPEIVQSSYPPFNDAVIEAVRQWQFAPGTLHGQPVDTYFELTVRFVLSR